jgi:hypothetical protein
MLRAADEEARSPGAQASKAILETEVGTAGKGAEEHKHKTSGRNPDRRGRTTDARLRGNGKKARNIAAEKMAAVPICLQQDSGLWYLPQELATTPEFVRRHRIQILKHSVDHSPG